MPSDRVKSTRWRSERASKQAFRRSNYRGDWSRLALVATREPRYNFCREKENGWWKHRFRLLHVLSLLSTYYASRPWLSSFSWSSRERKTSALCIFNCFITILTFPYLIISGIRYYICLNINLRSEIVFQQRIFYYLIFF